jgi:ABC-2 type transport system permease protein
VQLFFAMVLVLLVGPDLISQDLRSNAIPLYLSRPIRRFDYFLGKLGVIAVYLSAVTLGPLLVAYTLGVACSLDLGVVRDTAWLLLGGLGYCVVIIVSAGTLMLALSSLSKNSRQVSALWVVLWVVSGTVYRVLEDSVRAKWCPLVSYTANLRRLGLAMLGTEAAWEPIARIFQIAPTATEAPNPYLSNYPWTWSAGVLAGLWGFSLCLLGLRVRTLDRLK